MKAAAILTHHHELISSPSYYSYPPAPCQAQRSVGRPQKARPYDAGSILSQLKYHTTSPAGSWMHPPPDCTISKSLISNAHFRQCNSTESHRPHRPPTSTQNGASDIAAATEQLAAQLQQNQVAMDVADQRELPPGLATDCLPRHVSVIMDGNSSRWAQMQGPEGHAAGVEALMKLIFLSSQWGLSAFSVFLFSTENWNRSQDEVSSLMEIYEKNLIEHLANFSKYNIKVKVIGDKEQLPQSFQNTIFEVEKKTSQNTGMKVAFAINYGGRLDIIQAFQQVAKKLQQGRIKLDDVSIEVIENELWTNWMEDSQAPDLLIRADGEQRISNFFLWQVAYSEIMFLDVCFPALNQTLYSKALVDFQKRDRRYGKREPLRSEK